MLKRPRAQALMIIFSFLPVLALLLSACATSTEPSRPENGPARPVRGGTWIDDLYAEPSSLITDCPVETPGWWWRRRTQARHAFR